MDVNLLRIAVTLISLVIFLGIVRWAWSDRHRSDFSEAARLPLDSDRPEARGQDAGSLR